MKRIFSLLLVTCLLLSCSATVFADGGHSTKVRYVGVGESEWELDVPSQLAPGESGNVILTGTWDSVTTVNVTADSTVTLTNDIDESTKTLGITFANINQVGNMDNAIEVTKSISVAAMDGGLFGTWEGIFNYYVTVQGVPKETFEFTILGKNYADAFPEERYYKSTAEVGMTWGEWYNSSYCTYKEAFNNTTSNKYLVLEDKIYGDVVLAGYITNSENGRATWYFARLDETINSECVYQYFRTLDNMDNVIEDYENGEYLFDIMGEASYVYINHQKYFGEAYYLYYTNKETVIEKYPEYCLGDNVVIEGNIIYKDNECTEPVKPTDILADLNQGCWYK